MSAVGALSILTITMIIIENNKMSLPKTGERKGNGGTLVAEKLHC